MTREQIKKAMNVYAKYPDEFWLDFAVQQVNAALEEAAKVCDDGDDPNRFVARIRALKIGAGE